ncbi:uncharacterized protein LOC62_04G005244 [Vanrija pseudolonga]|uniref:Uncharacterized protein n=1 Tax=Vanrija pseudolonga TaxID=143232 RepID=A0AAF0Y7N7_9TREE|nr:hypothetical protein LOC62_04G005244 [Vanrija pseudolonga]
MTPTFTLLLPVTSESKPRDKHACELPYLPGRVEVLDVNHVLFDDPPASKMSAFKNVRTVRRFDLFGFGASTKDFVPQATTTVDFLDLDKIMPRGRNDSGKRALQVPPNTERYVLHVAWDQADTQPWSDLRFCGHAKLGGNKEPVVHHHCPGFLLNLFEKITPTVKNGSKFTVVGAEAAATGQFAKPAGSKRGEDTTAALKHHLHTYWKAKVPSDAVRFKLDDATRFLTREEFCAELGKREEIEGVWPPQRLYICGTCGKPDPFLYGQFACGRPEDTDDGMSAEDGTFGLESSDGELEPPSSPLVGLYTDAEFEAHNNKRRRRRRWR